MVRRFMTAAAPAAAYSLPTPPPRSKRLYIGRPRADRNIGQPDQSTNKFVY
jgi:hypothetical protein